MASRVLASRARTVVEAASPSSSSSGPVIYWMSRDQRCNDNWALLWARQQAAQRSAALAVRHAMFKQRYTIASPPQPPSPPQRAEAAPAVAAAKCGVSVHSTYA